MTTVPTGADRPPAPAPGARMLYVGQLAPGSTSLDRMRVLADLGVDCIQFDKLPYYHAAHQLTAKFASRYHVGPVITRLNRGIRDAVAGAAGLTHLWVDKGVDVLPSTLRELRRQNPGLGLIHYTPDPQLVFHHSRHFRRAIPLYDLLFTTKPFEVDLYRAAGARRVVLTDQAYDESRFFPRPATPQYATDVLFIGRSERHYVERVQAVASTGVSVKTWGVTWTRIAAREPWARAVAQGDGIWGDEYPKALCSTKIALGLLSKLIPETTTTRTFEIPACGVFMLAERTQQHCALFEEGKEAEFFSSDGEMLDKIKFYLANESARRQIAHAGRQRCLRSGYSNHDRLAQMLKEVAKLS